MLVLSAHLSDDDKLKITTFIRALTHNMPLVYGLKCLMRNNFLSQCHRIAIEEGMMIAVSEYIKSCTPELDQLLFTDIFSHFRPFIGFVMEGFKKMTNMSDIKDE